MSLVKFMKYLPLMVALLAAGYLVGRMRADDLKRTAAYPLNMPLAVTAKAGPGFEGTLTPDKDGGWRIMAEKPGTVLLFETGDLSVEDATLLYRAMVKTEGFNGKTYLEMLCSFPEKGEFFSRNLDSPISGASDWSEMRTPFFLRAGENPDNVKLNLVVEGKGTVLVKDVQLDLGPPQ